MQSLSLRLSAICASAALAFCVWSCGPRESTDEIPGTLNTDEEGLNPDPDVDMSNGWELYDGSSPSDSGAVDYLRMVDPISDKGQYYMPLPTRAPKKYWTIVNVVGADGRNNPGLADSGKGLQYHLLAQSLAGLVNRALEEGRTDVGIWLECSGESYSGSLSYLGPEIGRQTAIELATKTYGDVDGVHVNVRDLIDGYVLTDVVANPESNMAATVAAHIYNSIIVDVRDKAIFDEAGYTMKYDARTKTTQDAWNEFGARCSRKALVVMPVKTGELREFAIRNGLFIFNLNKQNGTKDAGQNTTLFNTVLSSLEPGAPVLGWEQGVGEDEFVGKVSRYGCLMLAADWSYNHTLTSINYKERQKPLLAAVVNPLNIDYSRKKNFLAFYLSDGDNYQWVMGDGYVNNFMGLSQNASSRMSYGLCSEALCQLCPARFEQLYAHQNPRGTIMETFGGGYFYVDTFSAKRGNRVENLRMIARKAAAHMRQHRIKVLHLMAKDWSCDAAKEAYQIFIDENDQLEGIITIQYYPYSGGRGKMLWFTNKAGYDIPVVSTDYDLWKDVSNADIGTGTPKEVAEFMAADFAGKELSFSPVVVHAWSTFGTGRGAAAAQGCISQAPSTVEAVSIQELIWRIRMEYRPEQTAKYLKTIK
ncbi:MAG: hypothetical protein IJS07_04315 [Bacteroidales bacterium]|nr:hypothetical protein [Bacteroidales bacterium]